jgi:cob(I)alamin adenosyltransferase
MAIRIDRVTTRGGDGGQTSLGNGDRVAKTDPRIVALGAVDEANAVIGVLRLHTRDQPEPDGMLARIQNDLFDIGADLSVPGKDGDRLRLSEAPILRLEAEVETMRASIPPLTTFVLPGGTAGAAYAHLARTVTRRAELAVLGVGGLNPLIGMYLNRLSDHLFVLARVLNDCGARDINWIPGANR